MDPAPNALLTKSPPAAAPARRLAAVRAELARRSLDGFIVPRADAHQGEYVPASEERLAWLTGFTGSAGLAIVLGEAAALFVDGRYTLQARAQVDGALYAFRHVSEEPAGAWLEETVQPGSVIGYDPWLHTPRQIEAFRRAVEKAGARLVAVESNPVDAVWPDRPGGPTGPVRAHALDYAGEASSEKRATIARSVRDAGADAVVLTLPESIAWLLNVRGDDVPHTPLPLSFAILRADGAVDWFIEPTRVGEAVRAHVGDGVAIHGPAAFGTALDAFADRAVLVDPETAAAWVAERLAAAGARLVHGPDPCLLPKARKNAAELEGARAAHLRDGRAVIRFLEWLDLHAVARAEAGNGIAETEAADRLLACRAENELFQDLSFDTISGAGPNGAIVHYRAMPGADRRLGVGELYLVDSGGQYPDGTTDITRTVAIGRPSAEMRERFTLVLKGHIAIATARFPRGTSGHQIDVLARAALWRAGLDYDHGTGHGVGSYLSVHEGPQRISKAPGKIALEPGMIVSNEPGYYKTGAYGIRIENLVTVVESPAGHADARDMLAFETLTVVPIDRRLIDLDLLTGDEIAWVDAYHARVREAHGPYLGAASQAWLTAATRPLRDGD